MVVHDLLDLRVGLRHELSQLCRPQPFVALPKFATEPFLGLLADPPLLFGAPARGAAQLIEVNGGIVEELADVDRPSLEPLAVLYPLQNTSRLARLLLGVIFLRQLLRLKMKVQVVVVDGLLGRRILQYHVLRRFDLLLLSVVAHNRYLLLNLQRRIRIHLLWIHQLLLAPVELGIGRALLPIYGLDALKLIGVDRLLPVQLDNLVVARAAIAIQVAAVTLQHLEAIVAGTHVVRRAVRHVD